MSASDDQMMTEYLKRFEEPEPANVTNWLQTTGRHFTPEWRAKIAAALRGRKASAATRAKMRAAHRKSRQVA